MKKAAVEGKEIHVVKAGSDQLPLVFQIRQKVFVEEQNVAPEEEYDEFEDSSHQFLAFWEGHPAGTARWRFTDKGVKLERFAVLPAFRGKGIGSALVSHLLETIAQHPDAGKKVKYLHSQLPAVSLYERHGFRKEGDIFEECDILHYLMKHLGH
jgi:predicted GNAT family N-acyltransferase